ncbi:MAG: alpha-1,2-fucosyltransferase [Bacteroidales bacterium]|jgi:hypothetical protein
MIVVKLIGGLGNQLFQYALGRHLAIKNNTLLKLDLSFLRARPENADYIFRDYELNVFKINENFATDKEIAKYHTMSKATKGLNKIIQKIMQYKIVNEKEPFVYDEEILNSPKKSLLCGFWQNEKYFSEIENIIRKEFAFKQNPDSINLKSIEKIKSTESISIHIRRYNPASDIYHGLCDMEYYEKAIKVISQKSSNPYFYIFSDDISWCKKNFKSENHTFDFIEHNADRSYEDLRLMLNCKHHIIANSTFSWWGAWLCANKDKIIIAPQKWLNTDKYQTKELFLQNWIKL